MKSDNRNVQVERVTELIDRFYRLSSEVFESRARQYNLSLQQMLVLITIEKLGPGVAIVEISRATKSPPSTLTGITNRLVEFGLIERGSSPDDRRSVRVSVTDAGRNVVTSIIDEQVETLASVLESMQPRHVDQFIETFTTFLDQYNEQTAGDQKSST